MSLRRFLTVLSALLLLVPGLVTGASAQSFETKATNAYMIDADTGTVLFAKDPDKQVPPASLAKLMTMEMAFAALKSGERSLDDTFAVSEHAWRTGGAPAGVATMFAALKSKIRLEDLIRGVIVQGANDGCIIIAEGFDGSEDAFTSKMNERAKALGLDRSLFKNASGLPAEGQATSMRDLATVGLHIWREYPEFHHYYSEPEFTWNKITQRNRNPLLTLGIGADGMALGFAEGFGYSIVGSITKDGRHVIAALGGMANEKQRVEETSRMLEWGLTAFRKADLFGTDEVIGEAALYGGAKSRVALKSKTPIAVLVPSETSERLSASIVYTGPVVAPVEEGAPVGELRVSLGETVIHETPLFAAESVASGSIHQRALDALAELAVGWLR